MEDKPYTRKEAKSNVLKRLKGPMRYVLAGVIAAVLSVAIYAGTQYVYQKVSGAKTEAPLDNSASAETPEPILLKKTSESFRAVAKIVGPAVVNVKSIREFGKKRRSLRGMPDRGGDEEGPDPFGHSDPFREFFERFGHPFQDEGPRTQEGMGTGIMIDKRGYIVTNNHVVDKATKVTITFSDDKHTEHKAKVVGTDPKTDLAVLKIENGGKDFSVAEWADSAAVAVGDWAIAIGSPFTLSQTVTVGIVSAKGRSSRTIGAEYGELLQTDAAINPGNSGGPLCTIDGKVMGVNTAIYTRSGGYMGIGFAIPSNLAKSVVDKLITDGKVVRGWLGVAIQELSKEALKELGLKAGISIHRVMEDSPAEKAGLKAGDVVVVVDGKPVKTLNGLQTVIASFKPGKAVKIEVVDFNTKKRRTARVKIGELPDETVDKSRKPREDEKPDELGLIVSKGKKGIRVDFVQPGAQAYGWIQVGDIIKFFNRTKMTSVKAYKRTLDKAKKSKMIGMQIDRKGARIFVQFNMR